MISSAREPVRRHAQRAGIVVQFGLVIAVMVALAGTAVSYLTRSHWSRPPDAIDAPPLPIVIAGEVFNLPPASIRVAMQRQSGPQDRVDVAYRWPELTPPDGRQLGARLFATIEPTETKLSPAERLKTIYPRYIDARPEADSGGLVMAPFADGTPFQGEDVLYDPAAPDRFLVRCTRGTDGLTAATCLYERTVGAATLMFRFPRDWLADWHGVEAGVDQLIVRWRPVGKPIPPP
jgi:hypothetical protein